MCHPFWTQVVASPVAERQLAAEFVHCVHLDDSPRLSVVYLQINPALFGWLQCKFETCALGSLKRRQSRPITDLRFHISTVAPRHFASSTASVLVC